MAGHSQFANIRFRKDRVDAKRAKTFAKLSRTITVAARQGGGSLDGNARLRLVVDKARVLGMPKDVIDRAIRKGTGESALGDFEEVVYEGYGPGGVALVLEILTDNRHRTAADVRLLLDKYGGNLGTSGAVAWMFDRRGSLRVDPRLRDDDEGARRLDEEQVLEIALEAGADDLRPDGDCYQVYSPLSNFAAVKSGIEARGLRLVAAEIAYVPRQSCPVGELATAQRLFQLIDALEDHEDVQSVYSNEELSAPVRAALEAT